MKIKGNVFTGVIHGSEMIEIFYPRLVHILKFEPFKGTLNVNLEKEIEIKNYSTKKISNILLDGTEHIDAYIANIKIYSKDKIEECFALWQTSNVYGKNTIEIISKEDLREKLDLKDNSEVEIEFTQLVKKPRKFPGMSFIAKLYGRETQLQK